MHPTSVLLVLVVSSCLFQAQLVALRSKSESSGAVHDLAKGFISSPWSFIFCVSLMDVLHAFIHSATMLICSSLLNTGIDNSLSQLPTDFDGRHYFLTALMGGIITWRSCVFYVSLALHDSSLIVVTCVIIVIAAVCSALLLSLGSAIFHPITALLSFWCIVFCKMGCAHFIKQRAS